MSGFSTEFEIFEDDNFEMEAPKDFRSDDWQSKSGRQGKVLFSKYSSDYIGSDCYITVSTIAKNPITSEVRRRVETHIGEKGFDFEFTKYDDKNAVFYCHEEELDYKTYHAFIVLSEKKAVLLDVVFNQPFDNTREVSKDLFQSFKSKYSIEVTDQELELDEARLSAEAQELESREAAKKAVMEEERKQLEEERARLEQEALEAAERAKREQEALEAAERERQEREALEAERARLEQEALKAEQERREREALEAAERERQEREALEAERARLEQEVLKAEQERREQEALEAAERERREREAFEAERARLEQKALEAEAARREQEALEAAERERQEKEAAEAARREQEALEAAERERQEREAAERAKQEQEAAESDTLEQEFGSEEEKAEFENITIQNREEESDFEAVMNETFGSAEQETAVSEEAEGLEPEFEDSDDGRRMSVIFKAIVKNRKMMVNEILSMGELRELGRMEATQLLNKLVRQELLERIEEDDKIYYVRPGYNQGDVNQDESGMTEMERYKKEYEVYKVRLAQWKKSRDIWGRTELPKPVEPVKPKRRK